MKTPEEIKKGLEYCKGVACGNIKLDCPYEGVRSCSDAVLSDAWAYIRQLEAQVPRWISVEEKLPEDQRDILTVNGHGLIRIMGLYHKRGDKWSWVHDERIKHYNDITHWMPLPEPPKEDDHG